MPYPFYETEIHYNRGVTFFAFLMLMLLCLFVFSGCAQLGISQSEDEALYTTGATAADVAMLLGKGSPDQYCRGDTVAYSILITSRNPADGVKSYAPADNAHAKLQNDGVKLGGDCSAVAPTTP